MDSSALASEMEEEKSTVRVLPLFDALMFLCDLFFVFPSGYCLPFSQRLTVTRKPILQLEREFKRIRQ